MTKNLSNEIFKIFEQTISNYDCPTALEAPFNQDFSKVSTFTIEYVYEEEYNEDIDDYIDVRVCFNSNNDELEQAISPFIAMSPTPRDAWLKCAHLLFRFLRNRAIEAIEEEDYLSAIGYIESLDYQADCIDRVTNSDSMKSSPLLLELMEQLDELRAICDYESYEESDEDEEFEDDYDKD